MNRLCRFSAVLLVVCWLWACKEKSVDTPVPQPDPGLTWQLNEDFLFDQKIQLTSYADSNLIMLAGSQTTAIAPGEGRPKTDTTFMHYSGQAQPYGRTDYRPLLTPSFIAFVGNDFVNVIPTAGPVQDGLNAVVRLPALDPDFAQFDLISAASGETILVNRQNQLIVPYRRYDRTYTTPVIDGNKLLVALVSVNVPTPPFLALKATRTQVVDLPDASFIQSMCSVGNYFIVSTSGGTYRIASDGTYQKNVDYACQKLFVVNGTVYGVSTAGTSSLKLVASTDQGRTWSVIISQLPDAYRLFTYKLVNGQLLATYNSQLFQLTFSPTTLSAVELDNTGLYGNRITSVAAFRNTVYVSTLSGVFTKPLRTFLTPKKE